MHRFRRSLYAPLRAAVNYLQTIVWRLRVRWGPAVSIDSDARLTVVLLSYLRPANIEPIIRGALKCEFVNKIVVQNNNPDIDIHDWVTVSSDRVRIYNSPTRQGAGSRWSVALGENETFYLAVDDDVFLFPGQIAELFSRLLEDASVPHGVHGVLYDQGETGSGGALVHLARREARVDVLHQLYLTSHDHVRRYQEILVALKERSPKLLEIASRFGDDVVISHCGAGAARIHNVGLITTCASWAKKGVALHQLDDFLKDRLLLFRAIKELVD
jgi:hypothetical protein